MRGDQEKRYLHNIPAARRLRDSQTESEAALWEALRGRRFLGLKFRRQHAVHRFVLDFYCHELRLAIEIDGSVHDEPERQTAGGERQSLLEELGIRFVRIGAADVVTDLPTVLRTLETEVTNSPSPAKSGEGAGG